MWHKRSDRPLPCLHDGEEIKLGIELHQYYGYEFEFSGEWVITAIWDGINEEFFEKETKEYIRDEDIMAWWEEDKK